MEALAALEGEVRLEPVAELAMFALFALELDPVPVLPVLVLFEAAVLFLLEFELVLAAPTFELPADEFELADV